MLNMQTDRLADIVMAEPEEDRSLATLYCPLGDTPGALRAEGISLRYGDNGPWILRHAELDIPPGQSVAITGPSSCGKTTLLKILMGLLTPMEGRVLVDGTDIRAMGMSAYRCGIAGVLQDDGLFAGCIAENICGFDAHPDQGWIEDCAAVPTAPCHHLSTTALWSGYDATWHRVIWNVYPVHTNKQLLVVKPRNIATRTENDRISL
jgi:ATP-binding cassette subfamily B protein RaxB